MNINKMKKKALILTMATVIASPINAFAAKEYKLDKYGMPSINFYEDQSEYKVYPKASEYPDTVPLYIQDKAEGTLGDVVVYNSIMEPYKIEREKNSIKFNHAKPGATYSAKSSNPKIVKYTGSKVTLPGPESELTKMLSNPLGQIFYKGVKPGKATLTITETYKGKTKVVGKTEVTIKDSYLTATGRYDHEYQLGRYSSKLKIDNRVDGEEYTFKVDKEGLKITDEVLMVNDIDEGKYIVFDADKVGDYKVTAYKTKDGKTTEMKTINVGINDTIVKDKVTIEMGNIQSNYYTFTKFWNENYDIHLEADGVETLYEPIHEYDGYYVQDWDKSIYAIVRDHNHTAKPGKIDIKVYRVPKDIKYDNHYDGTVLEKEYLGTTELTIVPKKTK